MGICPRRRLDRGFFRSGLPADHCPSASCPFGPLHGLGHVLDYAREIARKVVELLVNHEASTY